MRLPACFWLLLQPEYLYAFSCLLLLRLCRDQAAGKQAGMPVYNMAAHPMGELLDWRVRQC